MDYKRLRSFLDILEIIPSDEKRDEAIQLILSPLNGVGQSVAHVEETTRKCNRDMESIEVKLTQKEIDKMPRRFQRLFILQNKIVRCRKRKSGRNSINYEIRYRREGFNISVSSNDPEIAKQKFIKALIDAEKGLQDRKEEALIEERERQRQERIKQIGAPDTFHEFATHYFEKYRSRKVTQKTLENDMYRYKNHILPHFSSMRLEDVTPTYCQELLDKLAGSGKTKTNKEVYSLLNSIFKMAEPARDYFVGHTRSKLNDTYSDLSDEYLLGEGKKLSYTY